MLLFENPFRVLKASIWDDRARLLELADELSLESDAESVSKARLELTNPRTRIAAEIAWLPGVDPGEAAELLEEVRDGRGRTDFSQWSLPPLSEANLRATALGFAEPTAAPEAIAEYLLGLARAHGQIEVIEVVDAVNEDREQSGFPQLRDEAAVADALEGRRRAYRSAMIAYLDKVPSKALVTAVNLAVHEGTAGGRAEAPVLIHDLAAAFELEAQGYLNREATNITCLLEAILEAARRGPQFEGRVRTAIGRFEELLTAWDFVAQPIQLSCMSRGVEHDASISVASGIRRIAIALHNEHGLTWAAERITKRLSKAFAEVPRIAEIVQNDASTLAEMTQQANRPSSGPVRTVARHAGIRVRGGRG